MVRLFLGVQVCKAFVGAPATHQAAGGCLEKSRPAQHQAWSLSVSGPCHCCLPVPSTTHQSEMGGPSNHCFITSHICDALIQQTLSCGLTLGCLVELRSAGGQDQTPETQGY